MADDPSPADAPLDGSSPGPSAGGGTRRRGRAWVVVAGVLVVVVILAVTAALLLRSPDGYTDADAKAFREACTAAGGDAVRSPCQCLYEKIVATVPYDRYRAVDRDLQAQRVAQPDSPISLPPDVDALRVACVTQIGAPVPALGGPPPAGGAGLSTTTSPG